MNNSVPVTLLNESLPTTFKLGKLSVSTVLPLKALSPVLSNFSALRLFTVDLDKNEFPTTLKSGKYKLPAILTSVNTLSPNSEAPLTEIYFFS